MPVNLRMVALYMFRAKWERQKEGEINWETPSEIL